MYNFAQKIKDKIMKYAYFRELISAKWMIEPLTAAEYQPLWRNALAGELQVEKDNKPLSYYQDVDSPVQTGDSRKLSHGRAINVVSLNGIMTKEDGACHDGTKTLASILIEEDKRDFVIGHVLVINSGGGSANSVPVLAEAIKSLKKPIVAFVDGLMASAAMYAGSYCQHIIADSEDDRVGCIGTMIQIIDYPKRANLPDGRIVARIYATESSEKNLEFEEALAGNIELIRKEFLDPINAKFINAIRTNRKSVGDDQLKGKTFFAKDVVGTLIDEIGHIDRAFEKVKELAGVPAITDENLNKPNNSMKFEQINKIESCASVETQDGCATLSEAQLTDIDLKLSERSTLEGKANQLDTVQEELQKAKATITTLTDSVAQKDKRITDLEQIIENGDDGVKNAHHNGKQAGNDDGSNYKCEDPMAACLEHINEFKN